MRLVLFSTALLAVATAGPGLAAPAFSSSAKAESNTKAALQRIKKLNPKVNAVIATDPTALQQARALDRGDRRGALFGMPVLIKDNIESIGPLPTTAGSLALSQNITNRDAPLVSRLRQAGAVIVGKANLSEWANIRSNSSISGWSAVGGQTRNPHALNRNPCGSSSGSGAAVAAGMVPAAIGTETDGSITCPAAINGIVGFKPTVGLVSRTHIVPISHSQDTAGPMTRTVRETALVLSAIAGSDPADPATAEADKHVGDFAATLSDTSLRGKRIGVLRFATGFGTNAAFDAALETLRREGAILVDIDKLDGRQEMGENEFKVLLAELKADLNAYLATTPASVRTRTLADVIAFNKANAATELALFGQETFEQAEATKGLDDPDYKKARATSFRLAGPEGIDRLLRENNVVALIGPTMPASWPIDAVHGDQISGGGAGSLAAVAGYPHLTVPMGSVKGLPVGLSFMGPKWSDAMILSLGYDFEQASKKLVEPRVLPSIEESPEIAPHLRPAAR
ncbi:amidase [Sphingomonas parva]|uniref:Amidase n=1 Tax=Sphingomonas parva TaxID=2555898 RepID=A0A4Y8ZQD7_9SPHN|nr:amidase [Sphingomonas parva]TFI58228.1 amidase [Sphingomonas parva]